MQQIPPQTILSHRYQIEEQIGVGGMGVVYSARDLERGGRSCAIKVLKDSHRTEKSQRRFEEEIRCVRKLKSPHIVSVYETGQTGIEHGLRQYVVMELVRGVPLSELLKGEPLGPERAVHVALGVTEALKVAHREGVVHRDLKPANIIVGGTDEGDVVKILDFGIAKDLSREETLNLTRTGMLVGTPTYMSPERFEVDEPLTTAADLYSVGLLIYHMVQGRSPVYVKHPALPPEIRRLPSPLQICWLHVNHDPPPLADCPGALVTLTQELLAKSPSARPDALSTHRRLNQILLTEYSPEEVTITESLPHELFEPVLAQFTPPPLSAQPQLKSPPPTSQAPARPSRPARVQRPHPSRSVPHITLEELPTLPSSALTPSPSPSPSPYPSPPRAPSLSPSPPQLSAALQAESPELQERARSNQAGPAAVSTLMLNPSDMAALNQELDRFVQGIEAPQPTHMRETLRLDSGSQELLGLIEQAEPLREPLKESPYTPYIVSPPARQAQEHEDTGHFDAAASESAYLRWLIPIVSVAIGAGLAYLLLSL